MSKQKLSAKIVVLGAALAVMLASVMPALANNSPAQRGPHTAVWACSIIEIYDEVIGELLGTQTDEDGNLVYELIHVPERAASNKEREHDGWLAEEGADCYDSETYGDQQGDVEAKWLGEDEEEEE